MTREAFILKDPRNAVLLGRWRTNNEQGRRLILEEIRTRPLPDLVSFSALLQRGPVAPDVEWFYTSRELCALIDGVSDLSVMRISRGSRFASSGSISFARRCSSGNTFPGRSKTAQYPPAERP